MDGRDGQTLRRWSRSGLVAVFLCALVSGCLWGPAIQAPWYSFFAAFAIALAIGVVVLIVARVFGLRSGASAVVVVVLAANAIVFAWGISHSQEQTSAGPAFRNDAR